MGFCPVGERPREADFRVSESPKPEGPYIGRALPRLEDARLVAGAGRYTDDMSASTQRSTR